MLRSAGAGLLAAALFAAPGPAAAAETAGLHHVLRPDPELRWTDVEVTWKGAAPRSVHFERDGLDDAVGRLSTFPGGRACTLRDGRIEIPAEHAARRLVFRVDHAALDVLPGRRGPIRRSGSGAVAVEARALLVRGGDDVPVTARIEPPAGLACSAPWGARVPRSAYFARGWVVYSRHGGWTTEAHGLRFDVVQTGRAQELREPVESYLRHAAAALTELYETPPPRVQVLLDPVSGGRGAGVIFGSALHGGGPALQLLVGTRPGAAEPAADWVTTHELVHHGMPRIDRADAWLSEGFATYYQELLRARAGTISETRAWQRLLAGFGRGRRRAGTYDLRDETRHMARRHAYHRVYWSGAAIALLLDVDLRRHHGRSLDAAMREMARRFGRGRRPVRAAAILSHLDDWLGTPLFSETAQRWLASRKFPDVDPVLEWLGAAAGGVRAEAPGALDRRAMTGH